MSETTPYDAFGGATFVSAFTARFYALMDELPEAAECRAVHPPALDNAREKLTEYLTGWLGGPPLYTDKYGHPRLRMRHFAAPIGTREVAGWLACFHAAWAELVPPSPLSDAIVERVEALAHHMVNKVEEDSPGA
jgi:hemoglobin